MKQTAVEWLLNEIIAKDWWYLPDSMKQEIIEQSKAMEQTQIQKAYDDGVEDTCEVFYQMSKSQ